MHSRTRAAEAGRACSRNTLHDADVATPHVMHVSMASDAHIDSPHDMHLGTGYNAHVAPHDVHVRMAHNAHVISPHDMHVCMVQLTCASQLNTSQLDGLELGRALALARAR